MTLIGVVAANARRIRLERGLSQEALGKLTGLHRTWVGAVERGDRNLTLRSVERLADALDVDVYDLLVEAE